MGSVESSSRSLSLPLTGDTTAAAGDNDNENFILYSREFSLSSLMSGFTIVFLYVLFFIYFVCLGFWSVFRKREWLGSMEKELVELYEAAKKAADAAISGDGEHEESRCIDALEQLKKFPVNYKILVNTQVIFLSLFSSFFLSVFIFLGFDWLVFSDEKFFLSWNYFLRGKVQKKMCNLRFCVCVKQVHAMLGCMIWYV